MRKLLSALLAACFAATIVAGTAACGDGDSQADAGSGRASVPAVPLIPNPPERYLIRLRRRVHDATTAADCRRIERINEPGEFRFDCPASSEVKTSLRFFFVEDVQVYGSAAVVDFHTGLLDDVSAVLTAALDGEWALDRYALETSDPVGTSDARARDGYGEAVEAFLAALRRGDCAAYRDSLLPVDSLATARAEDAAGSAGDCRDDFAATREFRLSLRHEPEPDFDYLGGNETFGFYGMYFEASQANWTISVMRDRSGRYGVLDVRPSTLPNA